MLTRLHGADWTERLINECLFDFAAVTSAAAPPENT
jgi:hypothetical protein